MQMLLSVLLVIIAKSHGKKCWTVESIKACKGLHASDGYTNSVEAATPIPLQDSVVDWHERLHEVWRKLDGADPKTHAHKLATYHTLAWMASPFKPSTAQKPPYLLPRYLQLEVERACAL